MLVFKKKKYQKCMRYIQIESVLIFRKKKVYPVIFFKILLNYNFKSIFFFFFTNKNYLIRFGVFLTFYETIINFLNLLNI